MNIFALDEDPRKAAEYHCDQHIHKMITESAQMLSAQLSKTAFYSHATVGFPISVASHPCTLWLAEHPDNVAWLYQLCAELENQRFLGCSASHASMPFINMAADILTDGHLTSWQNHSTFAMAMPVGLQDKDNPVKAYREYYKYKHLGWQSLGRKGMTWINRGTPSWWKE